MKYSEIQILHLQIDSSIPTHISFEHLQTEQSILQSYFLLQILLLLQ